MFKKHVSQKDVQWRRVASGRPRTQIKNDDQTVARSCYVSSMMFDETQVQLILRADPDLANHHQLAPWHVMVILATARWLSVPYDAETETTSNACNYVTPPVALLGTSAHCIDDGLFETVEGRALQNEATMMEGKADLAFRVYCRDGASANSKSLADAARCRLPLTLISDMLCLLHILHHVQTWVHRWATRRPSF